MYPKLFTPDRESTTDQSNKTKAKVQLGEPMSLSGVLPASMTQREGATSLKSLPQRK